MFDYYRFRFSIYRGWTPEFGYDLLAPTAIFGTVLILLLLYLTSPEFGFLMWKSTVPVPARIAFGVVLVLMMAAYAADELKRIGLWLFAALCVAGLAGTLFGTVAAVQKYGSRLHYPGMPEPPSPYTIGAAFAVYLSLMLFLVVLRLRDSTGQWGS